MLLNFYHISSNHYVLFRDVMLGNWGRFVIALHGLRHLRSFPFLTAALDTQDSAAGAHHICPISRNLSPSVSLTFYRF